MSVHAKIVAFLKSFPDTTLFATRMVTPFGSRKAVDNTMYSLVKGEILERLAWGVFRFSAKHLERELEDVPLIQIVRLKTIMFGRRLEEKATEDIESINAWAIYEKALQLNKRHDDIDEEVQNDDDDHADNVVEFSRKEGPGVTLRISGHSSSFRRLFGSRERYITVRLKTVCPRKVALLATKHGRKLFKLWETAVEHEFEMPEKGLYVPFDKYKYLPWWITDFAYYQKRKSAKAPGSSTSNLPVAL